MHTKSNNVEIMFAIKTNEIIMELFKSFLQKYQEVLEEAMRGSEFVYDSLDVLYYNLNKVRLSRGGMCLIILKKIRHAYKSKYNLTRANQVILLVISDAEKWHYLVVKRFYALFRGITGNNHGDFYCLNCFQSYTTENKLKKHKKVCENHDYCYAEMPEEHNKTLKCNEGEKSMRLPFIIIADLECLLEKMNTCHNNPEKSSTTKVNKDTPSGYSLFTTVPLIQQKISLIIIGAKIVSKIFV